MGLECAKVSDPPRNRQDSHPETAQQREFSKIREVTSFEIKISNLRLANLRKLHYYIRTLKIQLKEAFAFFIPSKELRSENNILITNHTYTAQFSASPQSLANKRMTISFQQESGRITEVLRISASKLLHGPVKHDHLLKQFKSRILFDLHVDQYVHADVVVQRAQILWKKSSKPSTSTHFLSLIFSNCRSPAETHRLYQKHEKTKELALNKISMRNSQLKDAIVRVRILDNDSQDSIFQYLLPLSKFQQQNGFKTVKISQNTYQLREFKISQKLISQKQQIGVIDLQINLLKSKVYTEQMQCVTLSEEGIVLHTVSESNVNSGQQSKWLKHKDLIAFIKKIEDTKVNGISDYDFYLLIEDFFIQIQDKHFPVDDQLMQIQEHLLSLLVSLADSLQKCTDRQIQQCLLGIINYLCREPVLGLKYIFGSKSQLQKIAFSKQVYRFIINTLQYVIKKARQGINVVLMIFIHKFIAYAFFRFPWCQEEIIKSLSRPDDPIISQDKLAEIGASYASKSPSKNYFYDWETSAYRLIQRDKEFQGWMKELSDVRHNSDWARLLFDRDYEQLFYSLYSSLWDQAQLFLQNNGKTLWQYFPKYGQLLSIFFGQMNRSQIVDFSAQMTKCNMKLIKNEKLLTTFMMLIFPKTHLFETACVIQCLNLIECYFNVILENHKKLPYNFHYNYFYTGIRCILQSEHSFLLQKSLSILYKFYFIFSEQFQETINNFIIKKVFCKLFLHWCLNVRSIFHLLLIFKIYEKDHSDNPEVHIKKDNYSSGIQTKLSCERIISSLKTKLQFNQQKDVRSNSSVSNQLHQRMKAKIAQRVRVNCEGRSIACSKIQAESQGLMIRKSSYMEQMFSKSYHRKWSSAQQIQSEEIFPEKQKLKYLQMSLRQFQEAKRQPKPNKKVQQMTKMLRLSEDQ